MINPANETFGQARQGSVAAIIQVLNERLADIGIRTRAVVSEGMLQLLCEATTAEQLEKTTVVNRVRQELETISPQRIKRVKINSRIVKEEQLLWLEEINRDPENALLWAEVITLKRPFFIQRWFRDRHLKPAGPIFRDITEPEPKSTSLSTKAIGAGSLALLLLGALWVFRDDFRTVQSPIQPPIQSPIQSPVQPVAESPAGETGSPAGALPAIPIQPTNSSTADANGDRTADLTPQAPPSTTITPAPANTNQPAPNPTASPTDSPTDSPAATDPTAPAAPATTPAASQTAPATNQAAPTASQATTTPATAPPNSGAIADVFAEAVRVAGQAAVDGQTATTTAEWLDLAARWQRASDLMGEIPEGSEQYAIAQDRVNTYKANSQDALTRAAAQE